LRTSSPINVTLVASSTPVFMLGHRRAVFQGSACASNNCSARRWSVVGVLLGALPRVTSPALAPTCSSVWGDVFVFVATRLLAGLQLAARA
jgi:hypothetical protein